MLPTLVFLTKVDAFKNRLKTSFWKIYGQNLWGFLNILFWYFFISQKGAQITSAKNGALFVYSKAIIFNFLQTILCNKPSFFFTFDLSSLSTPSKIAAPVKITEKLLICGKKYNQNISLFLSQQRTSRKWQARKTAKPCEAILGPSFIFRHFKEIKTSFHRVYTQYKEAWSFILLRKSGSIKNNCFWRSNNFFTGKPCCESRLGFPIFRRLLVRSTEYFLH